MFEDIQCLVFGPRKAGTTLLHNLLDSNFIIRPPEESKLKHYELARTLGSRVAAGKPIKEKELEVVFPSLKYARKKHDSGTFNQYRAFLQKQLTATLTVKEFILADVDASRNFLYPSGACKKRWIIKEVGRPVPEITSRFFEAFPRGKIISISRNPQYIARSVFRDRKRRQENLSLRDKIYQAYEPYVIYSHQIEISTDPRVMMIEYEELVRDPARQMKKVCEFLGMHFSDKYTVPSWRETPIVVSTSSKKTKKVFTDGLEWTADLSAVDIFAVRCGKIRALLDNAMNLKFLRAKW